MRAFKLALGDLAIMIGSAVIPGVDLVDAGPTEGIEAYEVGKAAEVAEEIAQAEKALQLEQEIDRAAAQAWRMYDVWRMVQMGGAILIAGAGLTVVVILAERNQAAPSSQSSPMPTPFINQGYYPPGIAGDPAKERNYDFLMVNYGLEVANEYAASGIFPDTRLLMPLASYTSQQCNDLIARFGLATLQALANDPRYRDAIQYLWVLRNVPGIDKVIKDLLLPGMTIDQIRGTLYELQWDAGHVDTLQQVQLHGPGGLNQHGPDALLKDGTLVQCKSYTWLAYDNPFMQDRGFREKIDKQVDATVRGYPGIPIVFVFDSQFGPVPDWAKSIIQQLAVQYHVTITIDSWP